jgi:hypothetical protein
VPPGGSGHMTVDVFGKLRFCIFRLCVLDSMSVALH